MGVFDQAAFAEKVSAMFEDQIIALLSINASKYSDDALQIARDEAERRGIIGEVQSVRFDVFLNSQGSAGRLILLEEQLIFLSTGLTASSGSSGIAGELHTATRNVAAANLDFSALDNEGSWIYFLDQIVDCKTESKLLSGPEIQFVINEEDGSVLNGVVNCGDLSKREAAELATQILTARDQLSTV
jgi:hypothetical protein